MSTLLPGLVRQVERDRSEATDGELLSRYLRENDQKAFAALVGRHASMVLGTARRVVGTSTEADDVFQATFLILLRRSADLVDRSTVGNWLHGVTVRVALRAREATVRRRTVETSRPPVENSTADVESLAMLDCEIARLPEKYRAPLILCELQGRTRREVAQSLGIAEGTISSRLAAAHQTLAKRLRVRGLSMSVIAGPVVVSASLIQSVVSATAPSNAVALLAERTWRAMRLSQFVRTAAIAAGSIAIISVCVGFAMVTGTAADPPLPKSGGPKSPVADPAESKPQRASTPDGIYLLSAKGEGERVRLIGDDSEAVVGKRLGAISGKASLQSTNNSNSHFHLELSGVKGLLDEAWEQQMILIVDGVCMHVSCRDRSKKAAGADIDVYGNVRGLELAHRVAKSLKAVAKLRAHPGHLLSATWEPAKQSFVAGEDVEIRMRLRNEGDAEVTFFVGGQQRGPRDNQYRFIAQRSGGFGKGVPDTGDPHNFGGLGQYRTLKPREEYIATVNLNKWFELKDADSYRITGVFEVQIFDAEQRVLWDDLIAGGCQVTIRGKRGGIIRKVGSSSPTRKVEKTMSIGIECSTHGNSQGVAIVAVARPDTMVSSRRAGGAHLAPANCRQA